MFNVKGHGNHVGCAAELRILNTAWISFFKAEMSPEIVLECECVTPSTQ
jgi:hypothetical protein